MVGVSNPPNVGRESLTCVSNDSKVDPERVTKTAAARGSARRRCLLYFTYYRTPLLRRGSSRGGPTRT